MSGPPMAGTLPGVGVYLVDITAASWAHDECAPLLDAALSARNLPPYPGPAPQPSVTRRGAQRDG
jgi:hypothetical protein